MEYFDDEKTISYNKLICQALTKLFKKFQIIGSLSFNRSHFRPEKIEYLIMQLRNSKKSVSLHFNSLFSEDFIRILNDNEHFTTNKVQNALIQEFNRLIQCCNIYDDNLFHSIDLREELKDLVEKKPQGLLLLRFNCLLIQELYPKEIMRTLPSVIALEDRLIKIGFQEEINKKEDLYDDFYSIVENYKLGENLERIVKKECYGMQYQDIQEVIGWVGLEYSDTIDKGKKIENIHGFIVVLARKWRINLWRKNHRKILLSLEEDQPSYSDGCSEIENRDSVLHCFSKLSEQEKKIFRMHYFHHKTLDIIAEELSLLFTVDSFSNPLVLINKIRVGYDHISQYLKACFLQMQIHLDQTSKPISQEFLENFVEKFNLLLRSEIIYSEERFNDVQLREETKILLDKNPQDSNKLLLNRLLVEDAYPYEIVKYQKFDHTTISRILKKARYRLKRLNEKGYLFSSDIEHQNDLEKSKITDKLRKDFKEWGYELSSSATINKKVFEWEIRDSVLERQYIIVKGVDYLDIYER